MTTVAEAAAVARHDLRNSLHATLACLRLMERRLQAGRLAEAIEMVAAARQQIDRATELAGEALPKPVPPAPATIDASVLVRGMEPAMRALLPDDVSLELVTGPQPCRVNCDAAKLESAVMNLVINARDAMPAAGGLTIWVGPSPAPENGPRQTSRASDGFAEITVCDTGIGMDGALVTRVFEPYFTTKPPGKGTGLGLYQLRSFAEDAGGFIRLSSRPGAGTTVRVYLPLAPEP